MTYRSLFRMFSSDLAIDLGTANTLVYVAGKGIVLNEPSIVAVNRKTREMVGCGTDAQEILGRTSANIVAVRPLRDGVIADFELAEQMLTHFIHKAHKRRKLIHPRIVIGIPSDTTEVEKRAVLDSTYRAKASEVHLVEQAMVAALGAGLPVTEPGGNMVVDIGGGTTDIAVISLSGIVYARSLRMAGNQMDEAISEHIKRKHGLLIGERVAEKIKMEIGSAYQSGEPRTMSVKGRDMVYGLPKIVTLQDDEIREALADCVNIIVNAVRAALERTPPELSADISERGIILTGGGSLLRSLDERIRFETGMPVLVANEPLASVVLGTGKMLEDFALLRKVSIN
jgi:rod shape-determining protein MreB and related proteins